MNAYNEVRRECCPSGWRQEDITEEILFEAIRAHHDVFRGAQVAIFHEYFGFNGRRYTPEEVMLRLPSPPAYYPERYSYTLSRETVETTIGTSVAFMRDRLAILLQARSHEPT